LKRQSENGYKGAFVCGNHDHPSYNYEKKTLDEIHADLLKDFPNDLKSNFVFLENDYIYFYKEGICTETGDSDFPLGEYIEFPEGILIIGCTLWTDFEVYKSPGWSGNAAERGMNDYRQKAIKTLSEEEYKGKAKNRWNDGTRNMRWEDTIEWHKKSLERIDEIIRNVSKNNYVDRVIILSHHAPTPLSIHKDYMKSDINPAYCSNLGNFILDRPKIKLWCHGHIHQSFDYMVGNCRILCNPRGYMRYHENDEFNPDLIIEV